ncbi:MAG: hypothetical protein KAT05_11325 [Spirochaetes bacterium]|nr:hypothetical protein [Spirochaetota bacterium]
MRNKKMIFLILLSLLISHFLMANQKKVFNKVKLNFINKSNINKTNPYEFKKNNFKELDSNTKLLLRNSILFSTLSLVPFGSGAALMVTLMILPVIENYNNGDEQLVTNREVPGFVIGGIFSSMLFGLGVFFIVMGVINATKFKKALKKTNLSMFIGEYDYKSESLKTGITVKF